MNIPTFNNQLQVLNISDCSSIARWPSPPCSNHGTCVKVNSSESNVLACYCEPGFHAEGDSLYDIVVGYDGVYGDCDISSIEIKRLWTICTAIGVLGIVLLARVCLAKYFQMKNRSFYHMIRLRSNRTSLSMLCAFFCYFIVSVLKVYDAKKYAVGRNWAVTLAQLAATIFLMTGQFEASVFLLESSTNPFLQRTHSASGLRGAAEKLKNSLQSLGNQRNFLIVGNLFMGIPIVAMILVPHSWEVLHVFGLSAYMLVQIILQVQVVRHTRSMNKVLEFLKEGQKDKPKHLEQFMEIQKCIKRQNDESLVNVSIQMITSLLFVVWPLLRHKVPYYIPVTLIIGLFFVCIAASQESKSLSKRSRNKRSKVFNSTTKDTNIAITDSVKEQGPEM